MRHLVAQCEWILANGPSMKRILIVDDSVDNRALLSVLLKAQGYAIISTADGAMGLAWLRSGDPLPDLILLDLQMPVLDGVGFRELQRIDERLKDIPVVLMSGEENLELYRVQLGLQDVLSKPLNVASLIEAIERNANAPLH